MLDSLNYTANCRYLEDTYIGRDPFSPDPKPLILGSNCVVCHKLVCINQVRSSRQSIVIKFTPCGAFSMGGDHCHNRVKCFTCRNIRTWPT